ncbi:hypothetical protein AN6924.2 [Aspergillus nidulans FGSC A4]|uniref:Rhodopsin domain-containing protein n=1 Tax=Emericella nidulans (strain FGSC A4 / ATCC 38163 / CBS 112.46 / NRRL 194 / M139) TaxID=227321 RepID=Q5AXQ6_EMENI|nr:hypothetical protein [Aspergillus nidulans FGSC A4]EAA57679.1 hypothetical protein AN6924.2 [Aspergillus nidulans FGSC A4]CBF71747.1 TPA: conserved hypothetical protein [Aspergillus nidulans FGSC A4]|eukprot:XP_664528.1 hypothetical protein AN6924.2 [Aspergillus nidulans FGSC A4]
MGYSSTTELFVEWAVGLVIIAVRLYARWTLGKQNFYWDDLCLGFVTIFWTFHTVFLYLCTDVYGSNIGLNEQTALEVPDDQVEDLREGSIYAFIAWLSYIFLVWSFKGVLIFLYSRLTMGLWHHRLLIGVGIGSIATFFASLFFHLFICLPVSRSWQVKPYAGDTNIQHQQGPNPQSTPSGPGNSLIFANRTDIAIMAVPIPLVLAARIALSQKIVLCALFSSGIFVMIAAILRAYYSVTDIDELSIALGWASREALVSAIIVCAPGIKPLLTRIGFFRSYGSSNGLSNYNYGDTPGSKSRSKSKSRNTGTMFTSRSKKNDSVLQTVTDYTERDKDGRAHPYELSRLERRKRKGSSGESQEYIIESGEGNTNPPSTTPGRSERDGSPDQGILVTTDVMLAREEA